MSRLIDADKFLDFIKSELKQDRTDEKHLENIICVLENLPTAFDVEKVVVKLEAQSEMNLKKGFIEVLPDEARPYLKAVESYDKAIEIVKRGGIDENKKDN